MSKSTKLWNLVKHIPPYLFKVFVYLSHYSAPVASLTLQRNSYVVYLSRSNASPSSFTSLSPFIPLHSVSLYKNSRVLNSPYFSIPFFCSMFSLFVCLLFSLSTHHKAGSSNLYAPCAFSFLPTFPLFYSSSWQLKAHLAPVSAVDIPSGCWLDRPVTTLLARETDINISPLCCPYSSVDGHDWAGQEEGGWIVGRGGEKERNVKRKKKKRSEVGLAIPQSVLSDLQAYWILD